MKKRIGLLLAMLLTATILPVSVIAMEDEMSTTTTNDASTTAASDTDFEIEEDAQATDFSNKLEARMLKRRQGLKTKLTNYQETRLKVRCKSSQGLIAKVSEKAKAAKTNRDEIYSKITKNATKLRDRLKDNGQDTTKLDANLVELENLIKTFKTDMKEFRQAAADVANMDCAADPTGFKASIEALQEAREKVAQDSLSIKACIKDTLKPTLQEIHTSIGAMKKEENQ